MGALLVNGPAWCACEMPVPSQQPTYSSCSIGEVIKHGDLKCIYNEGMPVYKSPMDKGSLIIQFLVSCMLSCNQYTCVHYE